MGEPAKHYLPQDSLFLGFDSSTQSLKVTVLDSELRLFTSESVHFDSELSHFKTKDGVYRGPPGSGRVTAPVLMWVEALELVLDKLENSNFPFERVKAISGSAQQHGSVYWRKGTLDNILRKLDHAEGLALQLETAFSVSDSPVWMDSSTTEQCRAIEEAMGGADALYNLTGSCAHERYAAPQIRKLFETQQEVYNSTERISLVSSFMACLLVGGYASIDHTDGAGMNLMDLKQRKWSKAALEVTAPRLEEKLGKLAPSHAVAGRLDSFFVERYKFHPECIVIQWSGDNPNSLAGLALNCPGDLAISLGTSDTVFGITLDPQPGLEGHYFPNPVDPNSYMLMLVYKNGSLTREDIRNRCAQGSWEEFNRLLSQTTPLNEGNVGFYYKEPEILPSLPAGTHRFLLKNLATGSFQTCKVNGFDPSIEVRAIIEGQLLSMRAHIERRGMPSPPKKIIATGGASANEHILKVIASIFNCPVYISQRPDSASLGAALRAAHGWICQKENVFVCFADMFEGREGSASQCKLSAASGGIELFSKYGIVATKRIEIEELLLQSYHPTWSESENGQDLHQVAPPIQV